MQTEIFFRLATPADVERSMQIIEEAKAQMRREGRNQWNEKYPTANDVRSDIAKGIGVVAEHQGKVVAYGAVSFSGEPAYGSIKGRWLSQQPYVVVHRLAVSSEMKGKGVASRFMLEAARMAADRGVKSFKVDTNFDNAPMLAVLRKLGFTYCGEIFYEGGSRKAFEKLL